MSLNLETPLALASFIANNANLRKVYIPASFNVNKIIESMKTQHSEVAVVDHELFALEPPKEKVHEYEECTKSVSKVIVALSKGQSAGRSLLLKGDVTPLDPYHL